MRNPNLLYQMFVMIGGAQEDMVIENGVGKEKGCVHNMVVLIVFKSGGILIACSSLIIDKSER